MSRLDSANLRAAGSRSWEMLQLQGGGGKGFSRVFFLNHESYLVCLSKKFHSLPKQSLSSIYGLSLVTASVDFFWWGYMLPGRARESVA